MMLRIDRSGLKLEISAKLLLALAALLIAAAIVRGMWPRPPVSLFDVITEELTSPIRPRIDNSDLLRLISQNQQDVQMGCEAIWPFYSALKQRQGGITDPYVVVFIPIFSTASSMSQSQAANIGNTPSATVSAGKNGSVSVPVTLAKFSNWQDARFIANMTFWTQFLENNKNALARPSLQRFVREIEGSLQNQSSRALGIDDQLEKITRMTQKSQCASLKPPTK